MNRMMGRTLAAVLAIVSATPVLAARTVTGTTGSGFSYTASSTIVGTTSTQVGAGGGNPRYFATAPQYTGVVALIMTYAGGDSFICSGSLMADRMSILTAGHCVSEGAGTAQPLSTTAFFYGGDDEAHFLPGSPGSTAIAISDYFVNSAYTGQVVDENDIAVLRLSQAAPLFARSYDLFTGTASGRDFNVAGVGLRSDEGGNVGENLSPGIRRQGDNKFDFALGDAGIGGKLDDLSDGAAFASILLADFDNGTAANDATCVTLAKVGVPGSQYCDLGRGAGEAMIAGGDSGGPSFVDGKVAAVTSFGLTGGPDYGDIDDDLNVTFGEFGGFVSTAYHAAWINSVLAVPEPGTWALMLTGFAMTGMALRRRRVRVTFARD